MIDAAWVEAFTAEVAADREVFGVPGAAVALVEGGRVVATRGLGVRDLATGAPVTPGTRFRIGSVTKSLTVALLATLVDDGTLRWDDRVADLLPGFRAPTPELTGSLRLRDLLGMGSGIAEAVGAGVDTVEFLMSAGGLTATDVVRSAAHLPVIGEPGSVFSYNNTLVAVAAWAGVAAAGWEGAPAEDLFAAQVRARVLEPAGMLGAGIADDPATLGPDVATGHGRDVAGRIGPTWCIAIDGVGPAGNGAASAADLGHWVAVQLGEGVAPGGRRVVSAAQVAAWREPGIAIPRDAFGDPDLAGDAVARRYAMGWTVDTFADGRRLVGHGGAIDGFAAYVGYVPEAGVGLAVVANLEPGAGGSGFAGSAASRFLARACGLDRELPARLAAAHAASTAALGERAVGLRPATPAEAEGRLGLYELGFRLRWDDAAGLRLEHDIRSMTLSVGPDGAFVVSDGPGAVLGRTVRFARLPDRAPTMEIEGFVPVRWLTAG